MSNTAKLRRHSPVKSTVLRIFLICIVAGLGAVVAQAQRMQPSNQNDRRDDQPDPFMVSPMAEMRTRAALRRSEHDHQENLDRASELARLGLEIKNNFQRANMLSDDDRKKLERIEKLTKKIRSAAGGSDGDFVRNVPRNLGEAVNMLATATDELNKQVASTPKQVISASVIVQTNQLLELVQNVRGIER